MPAKLRFLFLMTVLAAVCVPFPATSKQPVTPHDDLLAATMAGEFALQAGRLDEAADWYLSAAKSADGDAGLAERATRIALLSNDNTRSAEALKLWRARAPDSLAMRAGEATLSLRSDNMRRARRELESLLRDPDPDGWRYAMAALRGGIRDPDKAADLVEDLVDADAIPNQLQPWLVFGGLAQRLGRDSLTERIVDDVIARFPGEPRVALLRASQLRGAGRLDEARAALAEMEGSARLDPDMRMAIAAEYDALGDLQASANILSLGPQDDHTYRLRASLLARAEDTAGLESLYAELKRDADTFDPSRRLLLGQVAEFLEKHDEALGWYRSVAAGPERVQARLRIANVLHETGSTAEAFDDLHDMQVDASIDDDARRDAYLLEAELRFKESDADGELDVYARGLSAYPDDPELLYARGLLWERRDDIPHAEADLRRILVVDPENVATLNALGYTLADRTTRYAEALELIDRARVADPDNAAIVDSYGWVLYRLGRNQEALTELRRAYTLQKDPDIAAHLGEVLWMLGEKNEARRYFEESRKLDPDNRSLQRALDTTGA